MIRPARHQDVPAIERLIRRQHAASKYAGRCGIAPKALTAYVEGAIASINARGPSATHLAVIERGEEVRGFIMGVLSRIYQVGDKLEANDLFFVNEGLPSDSFKLLDSYIAWARSHRPVIEIKLSWTDTLPGAGRVAELYRRKCFVKVGEIFEMRLDAEGGDE
jgi:hypothetical protein